MMVFFGRIQRRPHPSSRDILRFPSLPSDTLIYWTISIPCVYELGTCGGANWTILTFSYVFKQSIHGKKKRSPPHYQLHHHHDLQPPSHLMAQGKTKGLQQKSPSSRHAAKAAAATKKGRRSIAPKKAAAAKQAAMHKVRFLPTLVCL